VIDLNTGNAVDELRIEGIVGRRFDAVVLPGVYRPTAPIFKTGGIRHTNSVAAEEPPYRVQPHTFFN